MTGPEMSVSENHACSEFDNARSADADEIDLIACLKILWKHRFLVVVGAAIPALIAGSVLFFRPCEYRLTYTYDNWELDDRNFEIFLEGFYSVENIDRIVRTLKDKGFEKYAASIGKASVRGRKTLRSLILFEAWPPYVDLSEIEAKDASAMKELRELTSLMVKMTVTARSRSDVAAIGPIVREHVENVSSLFDIERELIAEINEHKIRMAEIEERRFALDLSLKTKTNVLAQLKDIKVERSDASEANVTLQFDIGSRSEYLPLAYHISAAETRIVELKEDVRQSEEEYTHYQELAALNEKLLAEIRSNKSSEYAVGQFHSFLSDMVGMGPKKEVSDYLAAYIKRLENQMLLRNPVADTPGALYVDRGAARKTAIASAVFLVMSVFAAFLRERAHQRHAGTV